VTTILRELNYEIVQETKLIEKAMQLFEQLANDNFSVEPLQESLIDLRSDIRRYILNKPHVPLSLATTFAQIFVIAEELEKELNKSTKYKDPVLKKTMEKILRISAELASKDDSTHPRLIDAIRHALDKLEGNQEKIESIKKTFERLIDRLESNDTTLKVKAMKLASLIMQSNNHRTKRREVVDQL